jgi:hypothetical protein
MPIARGKKNRMRMNGRRISVRRNDVIDDVASTGMQISDAIFAIPSGALTQSVKTALAGKDYLKRQLKLNPWNDDPDARRDLIYTAERSRNAEELGRIYKYAKSRGDSELCNAVETRAKNLGIWDKVKSGGSSSAWAFNPKNSRLVKAKRRRNPEEGAAHFYEKFHGEPSKEEIIVEDEIHEHEWLGVIGVLCAVVVDTPAGDTATIKFEGEEDQVPWLASSEDGCQLYIVGGNQELDLKALGMNGKEWYKERMVIGCFSPPEAGRKWNLSYVTEKSFDSFEMIEYQHDLGEPDEGEPKSARRADAYLEYDAVNKLLFISGGQYKIDLPLFGVSPGIEN